MHPRPSKPAPGLRFNHLTVLGFHHYARRPQDHPLARPTGGKYWSVQCDCQAVKVIRGASLGPDGSQTCRTAGCPYYAAIRAGQPLPSPATAPTSPADALRARHMEEAAALVAVMPPTDNTARAYLEQLQELAGIYSDL